MDPLFARFVVLALGLLVCFRGYSTVRIALGLTGFIVGAHALATQAGHLPRDPAWLAPALIAGAGLLTAFLILAVYRLGVILLGAATLVALALSLPIPLPQEPTAKGLTLLVLAVVGGLLSRPLERAVLSVATAFYGSLMAVASLTASPGLYGLPLPRGGHDVPTHLGLLALWILLALLGSFVQLTRTRKRREPT